jgi:hypothetical protein
MARRMELGLAPMALESAAGTSAAMASRLGNHLNTVLTVFKVRREKGGQALRRRSVP